MCWIVFILHTLLRLSSVLPQVYLCTWTRERWFSKLYRSWQAENNEFFHGPAKHKSCLPDQDDKSKRAYCVFYNILRNVSSTLPLLRRHVVAGCLSMTLNCNCGREICSFGEIQIAFSIIFPRFTLARWRQRQACQGSSYGLNSLFKIRLNSTAMQGRCGEPTDRREMRFYFGRSCSRTWPKRVTTLFFETH